MTLTEDERKRLEQECSDCLLHLREANHHIQVLKKHLEYYRKVHYRWWKRYEKADRKLAEVDRFSKVEIKRGHKPQQVNIEDLSTEDLLAIASELGVEIEE